jgi:hypothetical protein
MQRVQHSESSISHSSFDPPDYCDSDPYSEVSLYWPGYENDTRIVWTQLSSAPSPRRCLITILLGDYDNTALPWHCRHAISAGQWKKCLNTTSLASAYLCRGITYRRKDFGEFPRAIAGDDLHNMPGSGLICDEKARFPPVWLWQMTICIKIVTSKLLLSILHERI